MAFLRPSIASGSNTISERNDWLGATIWAAAAVLAAAAAVLDPARVLSAVDTTAPPFAALAAVVGAGLVAERIGVFRLLVRLLIPARGAGLLLAARVLVFTALISGLVNLDVAVVVAMPVALHAAHRNGMDAGRLGVATALTANAASFLLPTSNVTTLLVLSRSPLRGVTFVDQSWLAWILVTVVTVIALSAVVGRSHPDRAAFQPPSVPASEMKAVMDLVPMFIGASAIRALIGTGGIGIPSGFIGAAAMGGVVAAVANNLPAAAAAMATGPASTWGAVLALAMGPNLLLTGSIASLICRRIARNHEAPFRAGYFTAVGAALLPAQMLLAYVGLHLTHALR